MQLHGSPVSPYVARVGWHLPLMIVTIAAGAPCAHAQPALRESEEQVFNYAYATELGSGVYDISGRTLQIYRMPFSYRVREVAQRTPGVRLTFPLTVGLIDFEPRDVLESGLPEDLATLSFVPGLELDFPIGRRWHLLPYVEIGRAWDIEGEGEGDADVYSAGADFTVDGEAAGLDLHSKLSVVYTGIEPHGPARSDEMVLARGGIEARRWLGFELREQPFDWGVYVSGLWFLDAPDTPLDSANDDPMPTQIEVGVTIGPQTELKILRIPMPRVGLGYRFAEGLSAWRLVFGSPF